MLLLTLSFALAGERTPLGPAAEDVLPPLGTPEHDAPVGIINGDAATEADWPMTGGLLVAATAEVPVIGEISGRLLMCSSTLIAPDVVLLAAHCIDIEGITEEAIGQIGFELPISNLEFAWSPQADLSMYQLSLNGPEPLPANAVVAWETVFPDEWDIAELQIGLHRNHDIALMFLEEPVLDIPFAHLITAEEKDQMEVGSPVAVVGWGQQDQNPNLANSVGFKQMGMSYVAEKTAAEFKVGDIAEDVRKCHGDSGGPSFMEVETESTETWRLVGVTSHAYDNTDCRETGGVDTRVSAYLDWIDAEMKARCDDGSRSWCDVSGIVPPPDAEGRYPWEYETNDDTPIAEEEIAGCGCTTGSSSTGVLGLGSLALLFGLRRR